jgi:hypothetical protein
MKKGTILITMLMICAIFSGCSGNDTSGEAIKRTAAVGMAQDLAPPATTPAQSNRSCAELQCVEQPGSTSCTTFEDCFFLDQTFAAGGNATVFTGRNSHNIAIWGINPQGQNSTAFISIDGHVLNVQANKIYKVKGVTIFVKDIFMYTQPPYGAVRLLLDDRYGPVMSHHVPGIPKTYMGCEGLQCIQKMGNNPDECITFEECFYLDQTFREHENATLFLGSGYHDLAIMGIPNNNSAIISIDNFAKSVYIGNTYVIGNVTTYVKDIFMYSYPVNMSAIRLLLDDR